MKKLIKIKIAAIAILALLSATAIADIKKNIPKEVQCLAMSIYYEAKGESLAGKYAVADVVLNRVEDGRFPDTICEVITQKNQFHWKKVVPRTNTNWILAVNIAKDVIRNDTLRGITEGAVFFQRSAIIPSYADEKTKKIGNHNFFL
jgi:spore germination cell wall hydrolase CwlJ-like protein